MTRYNIDDGIPTLALALSEQMKADELRKLASLTGGPVPTRKADLADLIAEHLEGKGLRTAWQSLDELQKAAVAEVVHSPGTQFPADRFQAKYGRAPSWGSLNAYRRDERPSALRFFFYGREGGASCSSASPRSGSTALAWCAERRMAYALAERRLQFRVAAENPAKLGHLRDILGHYPDGRVLVIGGYLDQVEAIAKELGAPLVTGKTAQLERERVYEQFRQGELRRVVLSKVGNFAVDLPDADVLIQVSGAFGSRQEEAQRLGRILRPKRDGRAAHFFTLVSRGTREEEFAHHRKLFLTEQGYSYEVRLADPTVVPSR